MAERVPAHWPHRSESRRARTPAGCVGQGYTGSRRHRIEEHLGSSVVVCRQWLTAHHWVLESRSASGAVEPAARARVRLWYALNIDGVLDLFDQSFLLQIDAKTHEEPLLAYDTREPPGRSEAGRQQIRDGRPVFEAQMLKLGAIALDGTASTHAVADQLLALVFG